MAFNEITSTVSRTGYDKTGLGRWSWIKLTGKVGVIKRVITAYCLCNGNLNQPSSVLRSEKKIFSIKKYRIARGKNSEPISPHLSHHAPTKTNRSYYA